MRPSISKMIQLFFEQSMYEYQMDWRPVVVIFRANESIYETLDCWMENMCIVTVTSAMKTVSIYITNAYIWKRCFRSVDLHCSCEERLCRLILAWNTSAQMIHLMKSQYRFDTMMRKRWTFTRGIWVYEALRALNLNIVFSFNDWWFCYFSLSFIVFSKEKQM